MSGGGRGPTWLVDAFGFLDCFELMLSITWIDRGHLIPNGPPLSFLYDFAPPNILSPVWVRLLLSSPEEVELIFELTAIDCRLLYF